MKKTNLLLKRILLCILISTLINSTILINIGYAESTQDQPAQTTVNQSNPNLELYSEAAVLMDVDSSKVLFSKNPDLRMYPASTTKLLTALVVLDHCPDTQKKVNVSYYACHEVPRTYAIADLQPKEEFTISTLLNALLVPSANDAAYVLAEYTANGGNDYNLDSSSQTKEAFKKSIEKFSEMMNEKAKSLGCTGSHFVNPNGVHNDNHYSTAHDLALIGQACYKNPIIKNITSKTKISVPKTDLYNKDFPRNFTTTNILISKDRKYYYQYANGLKTGYTDKAGNCIVASAKKNNMNILCVTLHSDQEVRYSREMDCQKLFEYAFNNYKISKIVDKSKSFYHLTILNGTRKTKNVDLYPAEDIECLIKTNEVLDVSPKITINKVFAPLSKGSVAGTLEYNIDNIHYKTNLITDHDVESDTKMTLIVLLCLLIIVILLLKMSSSSKHKDYYNFRNSNSRKKPKKSKNRRY